jgi:N-acetylglucosamine-6-phosphate deacetylase
MLDLSIRNTLIFNGSGFLKDHVVRIKDGKIEAIFENTAPRQSGVQNIDLDGHYLVPAFIDLQVNGGNSAFFTKDLNLESLQQISRANIERGTLYHLPTLVTTSIENILRALDCVREAMKDPELGILGMHLEGPFLNPQKKGAHSAAYLRKPTDELLDKILKAGEGVLKMITIAPELFTEAQLTKLRDSGILIAAGHSMATFREATQFFDQGVKMATHLFNAMSPFQSREPGLVGASFAHPSACASIIVDGDHVDFESVKIAYRLMKGRLVLVSDAYFIGESRTHFNYQGLDIYFKDGKYVTSEGVLAGAKIAMLECFQNCVHKVQIPLEEALRMAALYPAKMLGLDHQYGKIQAGYSADLLVLDKKLNLKAMINKGQYQTLHST